MSKEIPCFGFFSSQPTCSTCAAAKRCKAVLVSNGFDITAELIEHLARNLPAEAKFQDTDRITTLVDQLLIPPTKAPSDDLLDILNGRPGKVDRDALTADLF